MLGVHFYKVPACRRITSVSMHFYLLAARFLRENTNWCSFLHCAFLDERRVDWQRAENKKIKASFRRTQLSFVVIQCEQAEWVLVLIASTRSTAGFEYDGVSMIVHEPDANTPLKSVLNPRAWNLFKRIAASQLFCRLRNSGPKSTGRNHRNVKNDGNETAWKCRKRRSFEI